MQCFPSASRTSAASLSPDFASATGLSPDCSSAAGSSPDCSRFFSRHFASRHLSRNTLLMYYVVPKPILFSCTMLYPSQTFLSSIVLFPWFNVLFVFLLQVQTWTACTDGLHGRECSPHPSVFISRVWYRRRHPSYLGFTSVLHRRWSPSSSRFKFQQAETVGWYDCDLISQVFVFITSIAVIFTFDDFVNLSSEVLCVFRSFYFESFFCLFISGWIQNMFPLCCCSQHECSFFISAASLATFHERLPRELQRVSVELVW